jgi:hypothetical protein
MNGEFTNPPRLILLPVKIVVDALHSHCPRPTQEEAQSERSAHRVEAPSRHASRSGRA